MKNIPHSAFRTPHSTLSRRSFLKAGVGVIGLAAGRTTASSETMNRYSGLKTDAYLGQVQVETQIEDEQVFTEGPAVDRAGNVFFTNVPVSKILKWDPRTKELSVFRDDSHETNGLLFDPDGNLLCCEGAAGRITRTDVQSGEITVVADKYNGHPFAKPNDVALDGQGRIYFTSRPGVDDPAKGNPNAVYRIDRGGTVTQLLSSTQKTTDMPNGIVTAPDDKTLYLIEAHPDEDHWRHIAAFDLKNGELSNRRILYDFYPGRSGDGMCIDARGNLYVAAGLHKTRDSSETLDTRPGIHVLSPQGKLLAFRETPADTITNCTFGGEDLKSLYVTCGPLLLSLRTQVPGKAAYRPEA